MTRALAIAVLAFVGALASATGACAQAYPAKSVRIIVPFSAGGAPDVIGASSPKGCRSRPANRSWSRTGPAPTAWSAPRRWRKPRPMAPRCWSPQARSPSNPSFHKSLPFNVLTDFEPVSNIAAIEAYILGVYPGLPARTVAELVALTRDPAAKISFGSPGVGNSIHLVTELFKTLTKTQMVHVPYRGAGQALTGLIAGDVQVMFLTPPSSLAYVEGGQVRGLAYTGAQRFARLPNVPTMAEAGVPGMEDMSSWTGMFAPARTPPDILARLHQHVAKVITTPATRERLIQIGVIPVGNGPAEFKPFVAAQVSKIAAIVKAAGIEPQ